MTAGRNVVVLHIGEGRFALYAHLKPDSVRAGVGDFVRSGEPIGQIGKSGKSFARDLRFHVMDAASPVAADGLPYASRDFFGQSVPEASGLTMALEGKNAPINRSKLSGAQRGALKLNSQVGDFE